MEPVVHEGHEAVAVATVTKEIKVQFNTIQFNATLNTQHSTLNFEFQC
jgi:hypothetical protein